ncbi:MAG: hypothetical protein JSS29_08955 [Proteobacteria bacterium]|nr:hypothetical protein [Pseudomonadota bacterium]
MKREMPAAKDPSLRDAPPPDSTATGLRLRALGGSQSERLLEAARAVAAASCQLELALREARVPAESLGESMMAISEAERRPEAHQAGALHGLRQDHLSRCIESLQFFDRLSQHVTHVCGFLSTIAEYIGDSIGLPSAPVDWSPEGLERHAWELMRQRLRGRLISDAQRELLDLILPPLEPVQCASTPAPAVYDAEGSVELF